MQFLLEILLIFFIGFASSYAFLPFLIRRMKLSGNTAPDMNKYEKPKVAELGGFAVIFGFLFAVLAAVFLHSHLGQFPELSLSALFAGILTIFLMGFLGIFDDLIGWKKGIRQYQHALIPILAALPLMALSVGSTVITVPFIGFVEFGILYSLIVVPLGVTGASNASNMLAGFNGLEAGLGIINATTMMAIALLLMRIEAVILMIAMIGALIAFMLFNWHPAKIFPGDAVTLMIGAGIASAAVIGNMEKFGVLLYALFFVELFLKSRKWFQAESFGIPQNDGTLKAPKEIDSITHIIMKLGRFKEKQITGAILGIQSIIALIVFTSFILGI